MVMQALACVCLSLGPGGGVGTSQEWKVERGSSVIVRTKGVKKCIMSIRPVLPYGVESRALKNNPLTPTSESQSQQQHNGGKVGAMHPG